MNEKIELLESLKWCIGVVLAGYTGHLKAGCHFRWEDVTANSLVEELNAAGGVHQAIVNALLDDERYTREEVLLLLQRVLDEYAKANIVAKKFLENFEPDDEGECFHLEDELDYAIFRDEECTDELILQLREDDPEFLSRVYLVSRHTSNDG